MSDARVQFLGALKAVSDVCDHRIIQQVPKEGKEAYKEGSSEKEDYDDDSKYRLSETESTLVCKGLMVASFNAFENFIEERWIELLNSTKSNYPAFRSLPDKTQVKMLENVIGVLGRYYFDSSELAAFKGQVMDVGNFFANVNAAGGGYIHPFVGRWQGSNISVEELAKGLACFHVRKPWKSMQLVYDVVLSSSSVSFHANLQEDFKAIVKKRHAAAHDMHTVITRLSLSEVPHMLRNIAFCYDILASFAVYLMCADGINFTKDRNYVQPTLFEKYWEIRKRMPGKARKSGYDYAAYARVGAFDCSSGRVGSGRARKVDVNDQMLLKWFRENRRGIEFIVQFSESGSLINWETCI